MKKPLYLILASLSLAACNPDFDSIGTPQPIEPEEEVEINFVFAEERNEWEADRADFNINDSDRFTNEFEQLPAPLDDRIGWELSGDDTGGGLFMFVKRRFADRLEPNTRYQVEFEITIATNTPRNCEGSSGEDVFLKAGATSDEPLAEQTSSNGEVEMNIDKGNKDTPDDSGSDAIVLGDITSRKSCEDEDADEFEEKTLRSNNDNFTMKPTPTATCG